MNEYIYAGVIMLIPYILVGLIGGLKGAAKEIFYSIDHLKPENMSDGIIFLSLPTGLGFILVGIVTQL